MIQAFNFSAAETVVGRWIDGKIVYRKVLTGTNFNTANMGAYSKIIKAALMIRSINGEWRNVPWLYGAGTAVDGSWHAGFYINPSGVIHFQIGNNIGQANYWHLIVDYTKN